MKAKGTLGNSDLIPNHWAPKHQLYPIIMTISGAIERKERFSCNLKPITKIHHLKMYLLLKMVVFHCYVSLPEGTHEKET